MGDNANPIDGAILNGTIAFPSDESLPIEGATINLDLISFDTSFDAINRTTTDASGNYQLIIDASLLPDSFVITASSPGFRPSFIIADGDDFDDQSVQTVDLSLTPVTPNEVVIETIPVVHHLGDDDFAGVANSQFQRSSEGQSYKRTFSLTEDQISTSQLTMITVAKGSQDPNEVYINSVLVGTFANTNSDGSYLLLELPLTIPQNLLLTGSNTFEVRSVETGIRDDIDDFEFVNISIEGFIQ